jgi:hypothetical protein
MCGHLRIRRYRRTLDHRTRSNRRKLPDHGGFARSRLNLSVQSARNAALPATERHSADESLIRCSECDRDVDRFTAIAERRGFWSDAAASFCPSAPTRGRFYPSSGTLCWWFTRGPWGCWRGSAETSRVFGRATKIPLIDKPFPQLVTLAWRGREISSSSVKIGIEFALSRTPQHAHLLASSLPLTARWLHDGSRARPLRFTLDPRGVYVEGLLHVAPPSVWRLGHEAVNDVSRR